MVMDHPRKRCELEYIHAPVNHRHLWEELVKRSAFTPFFLRGFEF